MQSVSSRIWTRVAVSIPYDDNHYTSLTLLSFFAFYLTVLCFIAFLNIFIALQIIDLCLSFFFNFLTFFLSSHFIAISLFFFSLLNSVFTLEVLFFLSYDALYFQYYCTYILRSLYCCLHFCVLLVCVRLFPRFKGVLLSLVFHTVILLSFDHFIATILLFDFLTTLL